MLRVCGEMADRTGVLLSRSTTQSIAKCSKMIPVLVVGALVWKKTYRQREWVAGGVVLVGCLVPRI